MKNAGPLFLQSKLFNYCDTKMRSLYWPSASCISPAVFALSPIVYHWSFVYLCIPIVYHWSFVAKMPTFGILMCICEDLIALCAILCANSWPCRQQHIFWVFTLNIICLRTFQYFLLCHQRFFWSFSIFKNTTLCFLLHLLYPIHAYKLYELYMYARLRLVF